MSSWIDELAHLIVIYEYIIQIAKDPNSTCDLYDISNIYNLIVRNVNFELVSVEDFLAIRRCSLSEHLIKHLEGALELFLRIYDEKVGWFIQLIKEKANFGLGLTILITKISAYLFCIIRELKRS
jgi:hypothetical protein